MRFKTMRRKQNLASALGIQMKIGGNHAFFIDNIISFNLEKKYHTLLGILRLFLN